MPASRESCDRASRGQGVQLDRWASDRDSRASDRGAPKSKRDGGAAKGVRPPDRHRRMPLSLPWVTAESLRF